MKQTSSVKQTLSLKKGGNENTEGIKKRLWREMQIALKRSYKLRKGAKKKIED